ncbi:hypothetical protein CIB84_000581, partial [Bambusicola thoracicus]
CTDLKLAPLRSRQQLHCDHNYLSTRIYSLLKHSSTILLRKKRGEKRKEKKLAYQSAREDGCLFLSATIFFSHSSSLSVKIQVLLTD